MYRRFPSSLTFLVIVLSAPLAFGLNNRSAVSVSGSDANPCTPSSPCRSFNAAMAQTSSGGEIIALDSAGYGPFTADRSVRVLAAPGVYAGISVVSGDGVTLNSGGSLVTLRNLFINGLGGTNGINDSATAQLYVDDCVITGFSQGNGLVYTNGSNWANGNLISISRSTFRNNYYGVRISGAGSFYIHTAIDDCHLEANSYGFVTNVTGFDRTTIFRSHLTLNSLAAVFQVITQGTSTLTEIESCVVTGNQDGLISDGTGGPSYIYLSNSTVAGNDGTGILPLGCGTGILPIG